MDFNYEKLELEVYKKRLENNLLIQEAAKQIGIKNFNMYQIQDRENINVEVFGKVCSWLKTKPNSYYLIRKKK